jgi:signal transduction histidine kinase
VLRRLLVTYLSLLACLLLALEVPLAIGFAGSVSQQVFIDRAADAGRFAAVADAALRRGSTEALAAEIRRYDDLYGRAVVVLDAEGRVVAASRAPAPLDAPGFAEHLDAALLGLPTDRTEVLWPWQDRPLVLAEPVGRDSQVVGAVLTVSPTDAARAEVLRRWALLAAVGLVALAAAWGLAVPVARWVIRPVHDLDEAAHEIAVGHLAARVSEHAGPVELRRLATSFNAMTSTVTASLDRQRAFVTDASHQLRNPVTALRLRLENLGPHLSGADGAREHSAALAEGDRLATVLDDLLALARVEATRAEAVGVDVGKVVAERVAAWSPPVRLVTPVPPPDAGGPAVWALPGVLDQVLDAVLDNAVKFGGGEPVSVAVSTSATGSTGAGGTVEIAVTDSGPGLSDQERPHATERFWRSRRDQNVPGTGLGLAIAAALLEASGGGLALLPVEPHGLRVMLRLPTCSAPGSSAPPPGAAAPGTSRSPSAGSAGAPPDGPRPVPAAARRAVG